MVKLAVCASTELQKDRVPCSKQPLDDAYEVPLERQTVVHLKQNRCCTRHTVGIAIAVLVVLAIGGAVVGVYLKMHPRHRQCIDWGPDCARKEPPKMEYHHDHHDEGFGSHSDESGSHSDEKSVNSSESGHRSDSHHGRHNDHNDGHRRDGHNRDGHHDGDQDGAGKRGRDSHERDGYHPTHDRSEPVPRPKYRKYPPGPAGPQGDNDGHSRPKHHLPMP